jgi:cytochrome bd ubiquinol oxidase subunit I
MQALSFAVQIPLVCFGIAFPAFRPSWTHSGGALVTLGFARSPAKRWSKVMLALFAVGIVTGAILSFELGLLWPRFMATFGAVFGRRHCGGRRPCDEQHPMGPRAPGPGC